MTTKDKRGDGTVRPATSAELHVKVFQQAYQMVHNPVDIARQFLYLREAPTVGQNRGLRVEAVQHWAGGEAGDSWCMEFVWMCLDIAYQGRPPFDRMQSCEALRAWAQDQDRLHVALSDVRDGDIFLYINAAGRAHHTGFVTVVDRTNGTVTGISGNTSAPDAIDSVNGDRVAEKAITGTLGKFVYVRVGT